METAFSPRGARWGPSMEETEGLGGDGIRVKIF